MPLVRTTLPYISSYIPVPALSKITTSDHGVCGVTNSNKICVYVLHTLYLRFCKQWLADAPHIQYNLYQCFVGFNH